MKIGGQHRFEAPRRRVWEALLDPEVLGSTLPGFGKLEQTAENEYSGSLGMRIGPVQGKFEGGVALSELRAPESYRMKMSGRGPVGFMEGEGEIRLEAVDDGKAKPRRP